MSKTIQILHEPQIPLIQELEKRLLISKISDPMEREMASWNAPWREESLKLYLNTGWSVGLWQGEELVGYFLAQPILFYRGLTQVLWLEYICSQSQQDYEQLIDTATRYSREKHLQSVFVHEQDGSVREIKTTKR